MNDLEKVSGENCYCKNDHGHAKKCAAENCISECKEYDRYLCVSHSSFNDTYRMATVRTG